MQDIFRNYRIFGVQIKKSLYLLGQGGLDCGVVLTHKVDFEAC